MKALSTFVFAVAIFSLTTTASAQKKGKSSSRPATQQTSSYSSQQRKQSISSYQSSQEGEITIGGRLGMTFSQFEAEGPGARDYTPNAGLMIGGEMNMWLTKDIALTGQVLYVNKSSSAIIAGTDFTLSASYLEVPIYAKYRFGSGSIRPYVFAGPAVGITLSSKYTAKSGTAEESGDLEGWTSTDIGLNFGAGVAVNVGSQMQLVFDASYAKGLNSIGRDRNAYGYHHGIRLMGGVQVPLK